MMKIIQKLRGCLCVILMLIALCAPVMAASPAKGWEPVKTERADAKYVVRESELEIKAASGVIIVSSSRPVQIKIFTILGRLVNSETLQAGRSQLSLPAHGVYIVKVGDLTCKVAV